MDLQRSLGLFLLLYSTMNQAFDIFNYDAARDRACVLRAFERDEALLDPSLPPQDIVDKKIIATDTEHHDRVSIYTAYSENSYAGFIAYYIEYEYKITFVQYLSVEPEFRAAFLTPYQHCDNLGNSSLYKHVCEHFIASESILEFENFFK